MKKESLYESSISTARRSFLLSASDNVAYGNMHPKPIWGRTKTLGRGDECRDLKLTVK